MAQIKGSVFKTIQAGPNGNYYYNLELQGNLNKVSPSFATFIAAHNDMVTAITTLIAGLSGESVVTENITINTG